MALGALAISPGMTPLSMGGDRGTKKDPIVITPGRERLKVEKKNQDELVGIGHRLLEALTGRSQQGGDQPRPTSTDKAKERDEKLKKSDTKSGPTFKGDIKNMVDSVKEGFGDISGSGFGKMFLLATGLFLLFKFSDSIAKILAPVLGGIKAVLGSLGRLNDVIKESPTGYLGLVPAYLLVTGRLNTILSLFTKGLTRVSKILAPILKFYAKGGPIGLLGAKIVSFFAQFKAFQKIGSIFTSIGKTLKTGVSFLRAVVTSVTSAVKFYVGLISKGFTTIKGFFVGSAGVGKIFGGIKTAFGFLAKVSPILKGILGFAKAIPGLGQVIMVIQGVFGAVTGFIEGFKSGGIIGGIKGALVGIYDAIVGSLLNLLADLAGWFLGVLGFDKLGAALSNLDFSFEGIKAGFFFIVDKLTGAFNFFLDGLKTMANGVIFLLNKIPGVDIEPFELSGQKKAREASEAQAANASGINDEQRQGGGVPLPAVVSGEVQTAAGRDSIEDFNPDVAATGDNVFGMSDRNKKYAIAERIREENPDMKGGDAARLAKAEFEKTKALKEAQAESTAGGAGVVVVNNTNNNSTNNNSSSTQQMAGMLGSDHTDPTQDLLSKANI